jgi:preprotein translocase subunit SecA
MQQEVTPNEMYMTIVQAYSQRGEINIILPTRHKPRRLTSRLGGRSGAPALRSGDPGLVTARRPNFII